MRGVQSPYRTTVGRKVAMAVSGAFFVLFVIGHMLGNMKVYMGPAAFNGYAEGLREFGHPFLARGQFLWIARVLLLASLGVHALAALQLTRVSRAARSVRYRKHEAIEFSYASRTMRWGGVLLLAFVVYHLMHFTWGNAHPDFVPGDAYHNFVTGFQVWPVSVAYMLAMVVLGLHLYHGIWSSFQTFGLNGGRFNRIRRPLAAGVALVVALGNLSFPVAVLAGIVQ
ncbi:MAG: succinate dehydrogenase cytochrome b subunit [Gemmatimonadota bacterium]